MPIKGLFQIWKGKYKIQGFPSRIGILYKPSYAFNFRLRSIAFLSSLEMKQKIEAKSYGFVTHLLQFSLVRSNEGNGIIRGHHDCYGCGRICLESYYCLLGQLFGPSYWCIEVICTTVIIFNFKILQKQYLKLTLKKCLLLCVYMSHKIRMRNAQLIKMKFSCTKINMLEFQKLSFLCKKYIKQFHFTQTETTVSSSMYYIPAYLVY